MRILFKSALALLSVVALACAATSPAATAPADQSQIDLSKSALVLIEYQRDWLDQDGKLHRLLEDEQLARTSVERSKTALDAARRAGLTIVHVGLRFAPGYPELGHEARYGLRKTIRTMGSFAEDGRGSEFEPPFAPLPGEFVVSGRTGASAFAGSNLDSFLRNNGLTQLYLMGYATHVCVESTFRQAHDLGYDAAVILDATAAFNREQQDYFAKNIVHHFGRALSAEEFARMVLANH
jgi:nicotinamidase-related amidase